MKGLYQRLKKKGISLVLIVLIVAFIVPYYAYAADSGAESDTVTSVEDSTGDFSALGTDSSRKEDSSDANEETDVSEEEDLQESTEEEETDSQENTEEEQKLTKKEITATRKMLQLERSFDFYAFGAEPEELPQTASDEPEEEMPDAEVLSPDVDTVISKVREYILSKDTKPDYSSIWNVIGLKRSGLYVPQSYIDLFYSNVIAYCESKNWQITRAKYSDYSKLIIALTAIGVDARDVMGHNLLEYLSDYENVSRQGNNGPIWALIALKSNPAYTIPTNSSAAEQNSEELLVKKIVGMQCQDGGWTVTGEKGDSDMTGMAMQSLASYYNKAGYEDVTQALDKGLAWIEENQLVSGGFGTMNTETSESVAQIITALCGMGIDCSKDARFIKNGKWPMTGLFQYYMPEGGFMHVSADAGNNGGGAGGVIDGLATEQGLYATVAYRRLLDGDTFLYDMSDVAISAGTKPVVSPTINTGGNGGGSSPQMTTTAKKTETKPAATKVKVIKVGLNYSTIYLTKGKSKTLKATVSPSNAANKSVKWSSSNKKIATVSARGKVTGKKAGSTTITVKAKDGSGKKATCKVVVTAPATATTAKKTTTTTAARSQTKRITTPTSGTTNRSVSTGSGTPTASGTTKTLSSGSTSGTGTGSTASKSATGTTAKKKDTAAEATTGSWNFSGEDYVPDTYAADETDAAEADTTAEKDNDTSKIVAGLGIFYIVKRICAIAVVVIIAFILYKKRHRIASALRNFQKGGDKE